MTSWDFDILINRLYMFYTLADMAEECGANAQECSGWRWLLSTIISELEEVAELRPFKQ